MSLTRHASARLQQRAIPPFALELLERFGAEERCGGAIRLFFDRAARKRVQRHFGGPRGLRSVEHLLNTYAVLGDNGSVITVGHRQ